MKKIVFTVVFSSLIAGAGAQNSGGGSTAAASAPAVAPRPATLPMHPPVVRSTQRNIAMPPITTTPGVNNNPVSSGANAISTTPGAAIQPGAANGQVQTVPNPDQTLQPGQSVQGAFQQPLTSQLYNNYNATTATPMPSNPAVYNNPRYNFIPNPFSNSVAGTNFALPAHGYTTNLPTRTGVVQPGMSR